jgi:hypothetical protein
MRSRPLTRVRFRLKRGLNVDYSIVWLRGYDMDRPSPRPHLTRNNYKSPSSPVVWRGISNSIELLLENEKLRLRAAGVNPNSQAILIIVSAWRFTIARYGDGMGNPLGDFIMVQYFWSASIASAQIAKANTITKACLITSPGPSIFGLQLPGVRSNEFSKTPSLRNLTLRRTSASTMLI